MMTYRLPLSARRGASLPLLILGPLLAAFITVLPAAPSSLQPPDEPMSVWFDQPAATFHESCVLGNGRLGAMDLGGVNRERIVLNESSLWSGGPYDGNNYDAYKCLPEVREKLFAGDVSGAWNALARGF
ncbi:MAG TPA: glycoside hydrolase N-terminal domain-containing protein, partial [Bacillota bacterium]|nr:glycoside hydrolase N-terminal domain-containing protein [Bacillota bacterium]